MKPTTFLHLPKIIQKTRQYYLRVTAHGKSVRVSELGSPWRMIPFTPLSTPLWKQEFCTGSASVRISSPALGFLCQRAVTLPTVRKTKALSSSHHPETSCCLKPFLALLSALCVTSRPSSEGKILNLPGIFSCSPGLEHPAGWAAGHCAMASLQGTGHRGCCRDRSEPFVAGDPREMLFHTLSKTKSCKGFQGSRYVISQFYSEAVRQ